MILGFCNTAVAPDDVLADRGRFDAWCAGNGVARSGAPVLGPAAALRGALRRAFLARAEGADPAAGDLRAIWVAHREGLARAALVAQAGRVEVRLAAADPLAALAGAGVALLCDATAPIRRCAAMECARLFLDRTKNGNRRFCDTRTCGNRARARAHYARHRPASAQA